ncbi:Photosystem II CP47 reaction center protein [Capsicum chinense]|nr:Photosystem II CP47 reaction center protein [Capsicum chinense]
MGVRSLWTNGKIQPINPTWGVEGFDPFVIGEIASHHIAAGKLGILVDLFHLSISPSQRLDKGLHMGNIKTVFFNSIAVVIFADFVVTRTMWYVNGDGIVRDDVLIGKEELKFSVEQVGITFEFYGGEINAGLLIRCPS